MCKSQPEETIELCDRLEKTLTFLGEDVHFQLLALRLPMDAPSSRTHDSDSESLSGGLRIESDKWMLIGVDLDKIARDRSRKEQQCDSNILEAILGYWGTRKNGSEALFPIGKKIPATVILGGAIVRQRAVAFLQEPAVVAVEALFLILEPLLEPSSLSGKPWFPSMWGHDVSATIAQTQDRLTQYRKDIDRLRRKSKRQLKINSRSPATKEKETVAAQTSHSSDFRSVNWFGHSFTFGSGQQAEIVKMLWEEWEEGGDSICVAEISKRLFKADLRGKYSEFRIIHVFRNRKGKGNHPAWKTMIVSERPGIYKLQPL